jgi:LAS superfamily LD-carboxypeptidase LdcB
MSEKIIKSVRIRERWGSINVYNNNGSPIYKWSEKGFDIKISVFKSGLNGKKRIVRAYDEGGSERGSGDPQKGDRYSSKTLKFCNPIEYNIDDSLDWSLSEHGEDAFIFQYITTQAAILKREKYYDGTTWKPGPYTNSELPDYIIAEWTSIRPANSGSSTNLRSPNYFGSSLNETDKKYRKKFGYLPPYFEIIQDPFIDPKDELGKNKLLLRNFGSDRYNLNNGASVWIEWTKDGSSITGTNYSDNWQRELDVYDIEKADKDNQNIRKKATIYGPNNEKFCLSSEITNVYDGYGTEESNKVRNDVGFLLERELDGVKYESKIWKNSPSSNVLKKIYSGGIYDEEILNEILEKWRQVYGDKKLELVNIYGTPSANISFLLPVQSNIVTTTGSSGSTGSTGSSASSVLIASSASGVTGASGATGASASKPQRVTGSFIFDVTRSNYLINAELGELLIVEKEVIEDPFVLPFKESEEDLQELSSEYVENPYAGTEESILEQQEYESEEVRQQTEAHSEQINSKPVSETYEGYVAGKHTLDMLPGEYTTNNKSKIKCCQIHGKPINVAIAYAVLDMIAAAKKDGITLNVNSGFRPGYDPNLKAKSESGVAVSAQSQEDLYRQNCKGGKCDPETAKAGSSKHGSGIAVDINTGARKGKFAPLNTKVYIWMVKNSWKFGFVRSVASEEWHYEYWPEAAKAKGPYGKIDKSNSLYFSDLGLNNLQAPNYA